MNKAVTLIRTGVVLRSFVQDGAWELELDF